MERITEEEVPSDPSNLNTGPSLGVEGSVEPDTRTDGTDLDKDAAVPKLSDASVDASRDLSGETRDISSGETTKRDVPSTIPQEDSLSEDARSGQSEEAIGGTHEEVHSDSKDKGLKTSDTAMGITPKEEDVPAVSEHTGSAPPDILTASHHAQDQNPSESKEAGQILSDAPTGSPHVEGEDPSDSDQHAERIPLEAPKRNAQVREECPPDSEQAGQILSDAPRGSPHVQEEHPWDSKRAEQIPSDEPTRSIRTQVDIPLDRAFDTATNEPLKGSCAKTDLKADDRHEVFGGSLDNDSVTQRGGNDEEDEDDDDGSGALSAPRTGAVLPDEQIKSSEPETEEITDRFSADKDISGTPKPVETSETKAKEEDRGEREVRAKPKSRVIDSELMQGTSESKRIVGSLPSQEDDGVKTYKDNLKESLKLQQYLQTLMVVARFLYIASLALANEINFITRAQELLFESLKLCDTSLLMVQNFQSSSNDILEKLKIAYLYLLDGFEDFARADVEATKGNIDNMQKAVVKTKSFLDNLKGSTNDLKRDLGVHLYGLKTQDTTLEQISGDRATGSTAMHSQVSDTDASIDSSRFRHAKGDRELLLDGRSLSGRFLLSDSGIFLPTYFHWTMFTITTAALATVVIHIIDEFDPLWNDIDGAYPPMIIATFVCTWLLLFFLALFTIIKPGTTAPTQTGQLRVKHQVFWILQALSVLTMFLLYLQVLDCYFKWWSRVSNNWISFPIAITICVIECFVLKLLCTGPEEHPNNIRTIQESKKSLERRPLLHLNKDAERQAEETEKVKRKERQQTFGRVKLTEVVYTEAIENLQMALGVLDNVTPLVEEWMKECEAVLEPALNRGIKAAESLTPAEKAAYWNSMVFQEAVVGYYCRWRALEVYAEEIRPKLRSTRRQIEYFYTENLRPNEAVQKAWKIAAEEPQREIRDTVEKFSGLTCFGVVNET